MAETSTLVETTTIQGLPAKPGKPVDTGVRRCAVTRAKRPQGEFLRFVVDPEGVVAPDVANRLPGRGVWVTPDRAILARAIKQGRFRAGFKADVKTPDDLIAQTERLLERRLIDLLGLARSAGQLAAGWEQVREFSRRHQIGLVVAAADAAPQSRRKLIGLAPNAPVMDIMDAAAIGRALGRDRVANALVQRGKFANMLALEAARRRGLLETIDDGAAATPDGEGSDR